MQNTLNTPPTPTPTHSLLAPNRPRVPTLSVSIHVTDICLQRLKVVSVSPPSTLTCTRNRGGCVCLVLCHSRSTVELWVMTRSGCCSIFNVTGCTMFEFKNYTVLVLKCQMYTWINTHVNCIHFTITI